MKIIEKLKNIFENNNKIYNQESLNLEDRDKLLHKIKFKNSMNENIEQIKAVFGESYDLNFRKIKIGQEKKVAVLFYISGLVDSNAINDLLKNLEVDLLQINEHLKKKKVDLEYISDHILDNQDVELLDDFDNAMEKATNGSSILLFEGSSFCMVCETKGLKLRSITEPNSEMSIRGPRDGFIESIVTNSSLLRRRIHSPHLWIKDMKIGSLSRTRVAMAYIKGLASEELIEEIETRLRKIDWDTILESGYIQEFIIDQPKTIFPLVERTERPDKVISNLVEGKIAILTDNTPFVLILPTTYNMLLQAPDDYYEIFPIGSFIRLLRFIAFQMSTILPAFYIAVITYHPELLPVSLFLRIAATREGLPFPILFESLLMESIFEVLREAGLRLPRSIGSAISIVGALVLGEAAINAGLVSPPMVVIVALTAIASFTAPSYALASSARMLRYFFILLAGALGLYGILIGFILSLVHLCSLRSFGQPYMQPYAPLIWSDLKDSIVRHNLWNQVKRPKLFGGRTPDRQPKYQKKTSPEEDTK